MNWWEFTDLLLELENPYWSMQFDDWDDWYELDAEIRHDEFEMAERACRSRDQRRWKRKSWAKWDKPARACKV